MRAVVQRVRRASVTIDGQVAGEIGAGLLVLLGVTHADTAEQARWLAEKIVGLRIFGDDEGKMNRDVTEAGGAVLIVSQFTLYGDCRKGRRPSFIDAAPPPIAIPLYEAFIDGVKRAGRAGRDGPVRRGHAGRTGQRRSGDVDRREQVGPACRAGPGRRSRPAGGTYLRANSLSANGTIE